MHEQVCGLWVLLHISNKTTEMRMSNSRFLKLATAVSKFKGLETEKRLCTNHKDFRQLTDFQRSLISFKYCNAVSRQIIISKKVSGIFGTFYKNLYLLQIQILFYFLFWGQIKNTEKKPQVSYLIYGQAHLGTYLGPRRLPAISAISGMQILLQDPVPKGPQNPPQPRAPRCLNPVLELRNVEKTLTFLFHLFYCTVFSSKY